MLATPREDFDRLALKDSHCKLSGARDTAYMFCGLSLTNPGMLMIWASGTMWSAETAESPSAFARMVVAEDRGYAGSLLGGHG
jgi:hypothetical protein